MHQKCEGCGLEFGKYFCSKCNLFDNDVTKQQFHCEACGICRKGGRENFFHCPTCNCCLPTHLKGEHKCIPNLLNSDCPICMQDMLNSTEVSRRAQR